MYVPLTPSLLLVVITSTKKLPGARLEMGKRLKFSSKRTRVPKKMTRMLAPFVERMNTSIDGKQSNTFQEISIGMRITLSKQGVVLSMGQSYAENVFRHQYHLVN